MSITRISSNMKLCLRFLVLCLVFAPSPITADTDHDKTTYGIDCSFAIFSTTLKEDCGGLTGRQEFYDNYMKGCRTIYEDYCDFNEEQRLAMSIRQTQSMVVRRF